MSLSVFVNGVDVSDKVMISSQSWATEVNDLAVTTIECPDNLTVVNGDTISFSWGTSSVALNATAALSGKWSIRRNGSPLVSDDQRDVDRYIIDWMAEQLAANGA